MGCRRATLDAELYSGDAAFRCGPRHQGHDVRTIPAQFVKPFVESDRNDFIDAEAIAEAVTRKRRTSDLGLGAIVSVWSPSRQLLRS
jgi:transposase